MWASFGKGDFFCLWQRAPPLSYHLEGGQAPQPKGHYNKTFMCFAISSKYYPQWFVTKFLKWKSPGRSDKVGIQYSNPELGLGEIEPKGVASRGKGAAWLPEAWASEKGTQGAGVGGMGAPTYKIQWYLGHLKFSNQNCQLPGFQFLEKRKKIYQPYL